MHDVCLESKQVHVQMYYGSGTADRIASEQPVDAVAGFFWRLLPQEQNKMSNDMGCFWSKSVTIFCRTHQILTHFHKCFNGTLSWKFAIKRSLKIPPRLKCFPINVRNLPSNEENLSRHIFAQKWNSDNISNIQGCVCVIVIEYCMLFQFMNVSTVTLYTSVCHAPV